MTSLPTQTPPPGLLPVEALTDPRALVLELRAALVHAGRDFATDPGAWPEQVAAATTLLTALGVRVPR